MPTRASEREDTYLGNNKKKLKKRKTDLYGMHVNGFLLHVFFTKKKILIIKIILMGMFDGSTGGSGSIFWTAEYQKNVLRSTYNKVYE